MLPLWVTMDPSSLVVKLVVALNKRTKSFTCMALQHHTTPCIPPLPSLTDNHTQKKSENFTHGFVLRPLQFQSTGQNSYKTAIWLCWLSSKISRTPTETNQNWVQFPKAESSFRKLNSQYAFSRSPLGQGIPSTNLLLVIALGMEPSYTHSS